MRFISAKLIYSCSPKGNIENGIIVLDTDGTIREVLDHKDSHEIPKDKIEFYEGALTPGFVNAHCHLELSYLRNKLEPKLGLDRFIKNIEVEKHRLIDSILDSAGKADEEMYKNGIVAVGDICNTTDSIAIKTTSKIYYHSFIETYAFDPKFAINAFEKALINKTAFQKFMLKASITPHAPYSVSSDLFKLINSNGNYPHEVISIHNQESQEENLLFLSKSGNILKRLKAFGIADDHFVATGKNSLPSVIPYLKTDPIFILVHNTVSKQSDISWMEDFSPKVYWCFCPKANLYIEDTLPDFDIFKKNKCKIVLGTDSLASNNSLNILEEIQTILDHSNTYSQSDLIEAACINGAKALLIDGEFGSFEIGKKPGINAVQFDKKLVQKVA